MPTSTAANVFSPPPGAMVARISQAASDIRWNTRPRPVSLFQIASTGAAPKEVRIPPARAPTHV